MFGQMFSSLAGSGSPFLIKYALVLSATPMHLSILAAIGQVSQIFQPLGSLVIKRRTARKGAVLTLQFFGYALAFCVGLLPFILSQQHALTAFLCIFFLSVLFLSVANNIWIGWITDIVPGRMRGRFFAMLSQYGMIVSLVVGAGFGLFIDAFGRPLDDRENSPIFTFFRQENIHLGFLVIFSIAALAAFSGLRILSRLPEKEKPIDRTGSLRLLSAPLRDRNFRRFLLFVCWWMLAVGIGAPFWQPFMLQKLHMSLFEVQVYGGINVMAAILALRAWGKVIDTCGNKSAMRIIISLGGLNPLVWLFVTPHNYAILFLEAITSGIMWSGAGLVATNFVLSIAQGDQKQLYSGVSATFSGFAIVATMVASGLLFPVPLTIGGLHLEPEQSLFGLTGLARWSALAPLALVHERTSQTAGKAIALFFREMRRNLSR